MEEVGLYTKEGLCWVSLFAVIIMGGFWVTLYNYWLGTSGMVMSNDWSVGAVKK